MRSANWQMFHAKIHEYMNPIWASSPVQSVRQWSNARHPVGTKNPSGRDGVMTCLVFAPLHPTIKPSNLSKSIWKQIFFKLSQMSQWQFKGVFSFHVPYVPFLFPDFGMELAATSVTWLPFNFFMGWGSSPRFKRGLSQEIHRMMVVFS